MKVSINMRNKSFLSLMLIGFSSLAFASGAHHENNNWLLLVVAIVLAGAAFSWSIKKIGFPAVLGELVLGMILAVLGHYHIWQWENVVNNEIIKWIAELGSILLLFEIGLESDIKGLTSVGKHGVIAAILGVVVPFAMGFVLCLLMFKQENYNLALFLGATLAATSTGISVRVFKDLGILQNKACQIVLTASIIDDVMGLIILSIVSALVMAGGISFGTVGGILLNVIMFFLVAILVAKRITPWLIKFFLRISNEESMVMVILIAFAMLWAWAADMIGLAAIIGSFTAGLMLDQKFFNHVFARKTRSIEVENHLIELVKPLNYILVPFFFVYAGMQVDIIAVASWNTLLLGLLISVVAIIGKIICGIFLPKDINRWIVGVGMIPRGEIGLIFAMAGRQLGIFGQEVFAGILIMVVVTSIITPILLQALVKQGNRINVH